MADILKLRGRERTRFEIEAHLCHIPSRLAKVIYEKMAWA